MFTYNYLLPFYLIHFTYFSFLLKMVISYPGGASINKCFLHCG